MPDQRIELLHRYNDAPNQPSKLNLELHNLQELNSWVSCLAVDLFHVTPDLFTIPHCLPGCLRYVKNGGTVEKERRQGNFQIISVPDSIDKDRKLS